MRFLMASRLRKMFTQCLHTWQLGNVLKILDTPQSEILVKFLRNYILVDVSENKYFLIVKNIAILLYRRG